jgi:flagellar motor switch protein FliG
VAMGSEKAADVLRHLDASEVKQAAQEMVLLHSVDQDVVHHVLDDFAHFLGTPSQPRGGVDYARTVLEKALGSEHAEQLLGHNEAEEVRDAVAVLSEANLETLVRRLRGETPQIVAMALSSLPVPAGATMLSGLPADSQLEVATKIATLESHRPEVLRKLAEVLQREASPGEAGTQQAADPGEGAQRLVDLLMRADRETEQRVLEALTQQSPELAQEVRDRMFVFEDIVNLEPKALQLALRQVEMPDLCMALKGASDEIKEAVFKNMSQRAAAGLKEDLETLTSAKPRDIGAAQKKVVAAIIELTDQDQIELKPEKDEEGADAAPAEPPAEQPESAPSEETESTPSQ